MGLSAGSPGHSGEGSTTFAVEAASDVPQPQDRQLVTVVPTEGCAFEKGVVGGAGRVVIGSMPGSPFYRLSLEERVDRNRGWSSDCPRMVALKVRGRVGFDSSLERTPAADDLSFPPREPHVPGNSSPLGT